MDDTALEERIPSAGECSPFEVLRELYRLHAARCKPLYQAEDLREAQWVVLRVLASGDPLSQISLSRRVALPPGTITTVLDQLEALGLVLRSPDADRRRHNVALTGAGKLLTRRLARRLAALAADALEGVDPADLAAFWRVMRRMEAGLEARQ